MHLWIRTISDQRIHIECQEKTKVGALKALIEAHEELAFPAASQVLCLEAASNNRRWPLGDDKMRLDAANVCDNSVIFCQCQSSPTRRSC